jgi:PKD repeat protein
MAIFTLRKNTMTAASLCNPPRAFHPLTQLGAILVFFLLFVVHAFAGQASLAWDANTDTAVAGYMVYYGQTSGSYPSKVDAGMQVSRTISGLLEGKTYYYAVTAYDLGRIESGYSNQASAMVPYAAPSANFSGAPISGVAPLATAFSNASSGTITAYSWTFGDGSSSTVASPSHSYATAGTYSVGLTVTGPGGSNTQTKAGYVVVSATAPPPAAPVASFSAAVTTGPAPLAVSFSNSSTGNMTAYAWNFGDGATSSAALPTHSYTLAGSYSVALTVTGPGGSNTMTRSAYIAATAVAPPPASSSLWASTVVPSTAAAYDPNSVELGVRFRSDVSGRIKGIRFYKPSANTGTHTGSLWTSAGTLLGRATFTETASGWQQVNFATPVAIAANTIYVASYHTSSGYYADTRSVFTTVGIDRAPLHAPAGTNGVYKYGTSPGFPDAAYQASNYWVDVEFVPN